MFWWEIGNKEQLENRDRGSGIGERGKGKGEGGAPSGELTRPHSSKGVGIRGEGATGIGDRELVIHRIPASPRHRVSLVLLVSLVANSIHLQRTDSRL
jgi:hypothetical protein